MIEWLGVAANEQNAAVTSVLLSQAFQVSHYMPFSGARLLMATRENTSNFSGLCTKHIFVVCANDLFFSLSGFYSRGKVGKQLHLGLVYADEGLPVSRDGTRWLSSSLHAFPPIVSNSCFQTVWEVFVPNNIHPAHMLQLRCDV